MNHIFVALAFCIEAICGFCIVFFGWCNEWNEKHICNIIAWICCSGAAATRIHNNNNNKTNLEHFFFHSLSLVMFVEVCTFFGCAEKWGETSTKQQTRKIQTNLNIKMKNHTMISIWYWYDICFFHSCRHFLGNEMVICIRTC